MNREFAYQLTLDAIVQIQKNIAIILEAKAAEAEKYATGSSRISPRILTTRIANNFQRACYCMNKI